jgi:hypothetical protein
MKRSLELLKQLSVIVIIAIAVVSCKESGMKLKPEISGKAGEIIVVVDKSYWETEIGSEIRGFLAKDYPMIPQKEPSFTLINIPPSAFSSMLQIHRNIIIINIDKKYTESKVELKEDIWSSPQIVVVINAPDSMAALSIIKEKSEVIYSAIDQAERNRIIRNSKIYEEKSLRDLVSEEFGGSPFFPKGYSLKKQSENFIWISYETTKTNQGIFVYRIPYSDSTSMTIDNLINFRNEILKTNVPAMLENSYMTTTTQVAPQMRWIKYKGKTFAEVRGLWEAQNDFMGGPFIQHAFFNEQRGDILVMEGFVYAPGTDKRNMLRQVESIIYSFEWGGK